MRPEIKTRYDAIRDFSDKTFKAACFAPFSSLYFDTMGRVRVCCHNFRYLVGNVFVDKIQSIWTGERIEKLRQALAQYDLGNGCDFCAWRVSNGNFSSLSMLKWDKYPVESFAPKWPKMMEFSLSNACNLECIMCSGEASSAIRARREHLPPLQKAYQDGFFEDLEEFLPHLKRAQFLGGEPFLQVECFRIWHMMIDQRLQIPCHVTTNGTQWNERIEQILEMLPIRICISMDGASPNTLEAVRNGASYQEIMRNFQRFHAYASRRGTGISLTYCLMRANWREFGEFCCFADEWGCPVFVNTVRTPREQSLYNLSMEELRFVLKSLESEASTLLPKLRLNLAVWVDEFERLRDFFRAKQRSRHGCTPPV